jgi:hypothetical protein
MSDSTNALLNAVAELTEETQEAHEFLEMIANHPETQPELRIKVLEINTTIGVQNLLLRRLTESQLEIEDRLKTLADKIDKM